MRWLAIVGLMCAFGCSGADGQGGGDQGNPLTGGTSESFDESRLDVDDPQIDSCRKWLKENLDQPVWQEVAWEITEHDDAGKYSHCRIKVRTPSPESSVKLRLFVLMVRDSTMKVFDASEKKVP